MYIIIGKVESLVNFDKFFSDAIDTSLIIGDNFARMSPIIYKD